MILILIHSVIIKVYYLIYNINLTIVIKVYYLIYNTNLTIEVFIYWNLLNYYIIYKKLLEKEENIIFHKLCKVSINDINING